ncbi:hypothetical protein HMPREF9374_0394 [Desmospora sp. 8437]|nr:hypothetical protein HMPREF9374_0394 [Desmospora sp. 8437]
MGFRNYSPGLNRFTTRDMYNGAGADMNLGTDQWTMNRYAFAGGNPVSGVELDGHVPMEVKDGHITAEEYHQATGHTIGGVKTPWKPAMSRAKPRIEQREVGKAVNDYKELLSQNILPMDHWNWIANRSDELEQRFGLRVANQFVFETNTIRLSLSPETAVDPSAQGNILVGSGLISSIAIRYKGGGGSGGVGKLVSRGFVDPGDVRFTQDSIKYQFGDKSGTVDDLIKGLKSGKINPRDIPPIRIFEMNGKIYSLDNRRLYAFKQAGLEVPYEIADPRVVRKQIGTPENMNGWKFTTPNDGQSIRLRR